ncbi:hypothetical protein PIB30_068826 [Stylosanthes scabra]|uniref:Uncharacterized protein n=1 Tax=Stylosanthes scabra TaxID=79078 RepID=A0ABU6TMQ7_9FABA|nr:hypothetical protein [Stylosanthes scabra]
MLMAWLTVLKNMSEVAVELRECSIGDPEGTCCLVIRLPPKARRVILAEKFRQHCLDSGFPRTIKVCSNGVCFATLKPDAFIDNKRITVRDDLNGHKVVHLTIRPTLLDHFNKSIRCFQGNIHED